MVFLFLLLLVFSSIQAQNTLDLPTISENGYIVLKNTDTLHSDFFIRFNPLLNNLELKVNDKRKRKDKILSPNKVRSFVWNNRTFVSGKVYNHPFKYTFLEVLSSGKVNLYGHTFLDERPTGRKNQTFINYEYYLQQGDKKKILVKKNPRAFLKQIQHYIKDINLDFIKEKKWSYKDIENIISTINP